MERFLQGIELGINPWLLAGLVAWSLFWKGLALWRAARNGHRGWFVVILLINTLGILEMLYLGIWGRQRLALRGWFR
jgi:methionyl-tRNA synthetase